MCFYFALFCFVLIESRISIVSRNRFRDKSNHREIILNARGFNLFYVNLNTVFSSRDVAKKTIQRHAK